MVKRDWIVIEATVPQSKSERIRALADGTRTAPEIAELVGCPTPSVYRTAYQYDLKLKRLQRGRRPSGRVSERDEVARLTTAAKLRELADGTRTARELSILSGVSYNYAYKIAKAEDLPLKPSPRGLKPSGAHLDRDVEIIRRLKAGDTLEQIGDDFSITRSRVRQIGFRHGINSARGRLNAAHRRAEAQVARQARIKGRERLKAVWTEMVKSGLSIRSAGFMLGLTESQITCLGGKFKLGLITQHGRWRDRR